MTDLNGRYYEDIPKKEKNYGARKFYKKKSGTESKYELNKIKSEAKMEKKKQRNRSKNNPKFFTEIPKEVKVLNLDENNILQRLGNLRRRQKQNKEILAKARGELIQTSKEINKILDELS